MELRNVSKEGLDIVGSGVSGTVYRLDEDKVLKVYKKEVSFDEVKRQERIAQKVSSENIPTARVYELVKCEDCYGAISDFLDGVPLVQYIGNDVQRRQKSAVKMGKLLSKVHGMTPDKEVFPSLKDMLRDVIYRVKEYFTDDEISAFTGFLDALPGRSRVLHGDFHENNIMIGNKNEEFYLIDLDGMSIGSPIFEFAQTYSVYKQELPPEIAKELGITKELINGFLNTFVSSYFEAMGKRITDREFVELDALFTEMSAYSLFFFPLLSNTADDPDSKQKLEDYIKDEMPKILKLMESLKEKFKSELIKEVFS
ncbi:MAG: phosphotransferase [Lachnospiraceae bacterium]|nr:phosphotransferase [Lachnospiraceae bacterium]